MAYTSYVVLDYGFFKKQILYKNNIRKNNYEENDKDGKRFFDDEIKKYNKLDDIEKDLYDRGFIELYELNTTNKELNKKRSIRRAKNNVYNISILNSWDYFITLTFSKEKVKSRYDLEDLKKRTLLYFKKQSNKHGIKYLLIPELHKDGALHWHGLVKDEHKKLQIEKTDFKSNSNRYVYNLCSWADNKGYNTAVKISKDLESLSKVSSYISKYITKMEDRIFNKYYYCSNGLITKPKIKYDDKIPIDFFLDGENMYENEFCYIKTVYKKEEIEKC